MRISTTVLVLGVLATGSCVSASRASAAADATVACERAILSGSQKLAHATLAATASCESRKRAAQLPPGTDCATEAKTVDARAKASASLAKSVAMRCGGGDRQCGTADDLAPGALGWPAVCPDFEGARCTAAIGNCANIATCEGCVDGVATDRARALLFDSLLPADPKLQKALRRCQATIGKEGAKLFDASWKALTRCWDARLAGKHANVCPSPGDGKAATMIASAAAAARTKICKACGGRDGKCDGVADIAVAQIGFDAECPSVADCGHAIGTVGDLADCLACTSRARAACAVALAAPSVAPYPAACAAPLPTPTVSPTPPATTTPSAASTPGAIGCPVSAPGSATSSVTITLDAAVPVGAASLLLDYPPAEVRLPSLGGGTDVRARVTDLTAGGLFDKGAPNNQDSNNDGEADRVRFTLVAPDGVNGAILRVDFDRCDGAATTVAANYTCLVAGTVVAVDGVTPIAGAACHVTLPP